MRYTKSFIVARADRAFKAAGLNTGAPYVDGKAQVGVVYVTHNSFYGWSIEQIANNAGGVRRLCESCKASELVSFLSGMLLACEVRS